MNFKKKRNYETKLETPFFKTSVLFIAVVSMSWRVENTMKKNCNNIEWKMVFIFYKLVK